MLIVAFAAGLISFALAVALESAFDASTAVRLEIATPQQGFRGRAVRHFARQAGHLQATLFALKAVGLSALGISGSLLVAPGLALRLDSAGLSPTLSAIVAIAFAATAIGFVLVGGGVLLPRWISLNRPEAAVLFLSPLVRLASFLVPRATDSRGAEGRYWPWQLPSASSATTTDNGDAFLENVVDMSSTRVKDSMVPRTDIEAVEEGVSIHEVRQRFVQTGYSKLAVIRVNLDHVVGIAFAHDLFDMPESLAEITRPIRFVPETKLSRDLLHEFLATSSSVAIVIDEYGGTAGLVTREDLLEELFGEIEDEFDSDDFVAERHPDGSLMVSGRLDLATLEDRFGISLREGDYESVGGYLLERLGSIPPVGTDIVDDGFRFMVVRATANRIDLVRISPVASA
jgi:putative hemolysin